MAIQVDGASLAFGDLLVLDDISFDVADGEFVSILGPSGSGKSSLLKALAGIHSLDQGKIVVGGHQVDGLNDYFSYMPQDDMLFDWLTVYQNITLYYRFNDEPLDEDRIDDMLRIAGLSDYKHYLPKQLSGGMRQRAAFIRTLVNPADYLLLDEPLGALDAMTRSLMQDWLLEVLETNDRTTLLVTHDIEEAIYLSDKIILLSHRPAQIHQVYSIQTDHRDRNWLASMGPLKNEIYQELQDENYLL